MVCTPMGTVNFGRVAFEAVAAGGGDAASGDFQAGAGDESLIDGVANVHVTVHGAFGFDGGR